MRVVVTGGLGFVGSEIVRSLLARSDVESLIFLARGRGGATAQERFDKMTAHWARFGRPAAGLGRVEVMDHDLATDAPPRFTGKVDYIVHAAASTDLGEPLQAARRANLYATEKLLIAAMRLPSLKRLAHLSTAYVCGRRPGAIDGTKAPTAFHNNYERSKWEAEECVRQSRVPHVIVRPSMVVGRSDDGYAAQIKVLYAVWRVWLLGLLPRAPLNLRAWVDIVPVDYVANATLALMTHPNVATRAWHICAGTDRQTVRQLVHDAARAFAVAEPATWPVWVAQAFKRRPLYWTLPHGVREILDYMVWHLPYLSMEDRLFETSDTERLLASIGVTKPAYKDYGLGLFEFLRETAWGKRPSQRSEACSPSISAVR